MKTLCSFVICGVFAHAKLLFGYKTPIPMIESDSRQLSSQTSNENGRSGIDHRNNFCEVHQKVALQKLSRREALIGLNISIGVQPYAINQKTGKLSENYIAIKVLDEIAKRAKFNYKDSFGVVSERTKNETFTNVITFTVDHYDVAADWWIRSLDRVDKGLSSTLKWYDSSMIMITAKSVDEETGGIDWFAAFRPLDGSVWLFTAVTIIITGFAYHANDYIMHHRRPEDRDRLGANIFKSYMAFTGNVLFEPRFLPNRLLLSSIALLCMIFVSAYTANLASFLVNDNRTITIERFPDVMKYDYRVCVWSGVAELPSIRLEYPEVRYVEKENELKIYQGLASGECEVALVSKESHERFVNQKEYNPTCGLKVVGFPVRASTASFMLRSSMELCSSIVREVLDIFLLEITEDGTLDKIKKDLYQGSQDCEMEWKGGKENQSLSLSDFSGIFIMYYSALVLTLILALLHIVFPKYIKSNINEIFIVRRAASFLRVLVSGIFSRNTKENHQLEGEVNKSDDKENSLEIQLDRKLLKMKSEILDELKFEIRKEAAETKKTLKEMQIFQWENERSF